MNKKIDVLIGVGGCEIFSNPLREKKNLMITKEEKIKLELKELKNRKVKYVIEGKELLIEEITVPKGRKIYIDQMVEYALVQKFHYLDEIAYDYRVISTQKKLLKILVYCINLSNLILLDKEKLQGSYVQSVRVLQQIYGEAFYKVLKLKEFYGVAIIKNFFYFFHIKKGNLIYNRVEEFEEISEIEGFIKEISYSLEKSSTIYVYFEEAVDEINISIGLIGGVNVVPIDLRKNKFKKVLKLRRSNEGTVLS